MFVSQVPNSLRLHFWKLDSQIIGHSARYVRSRTRQAFDIVPRPTRDFGSSLTMLSKHYVS